MRGSRATDSRPRRSAPSSLDPQSMSRGPSSVSWGTSRSRIAPGWPETRHSRQLRQQRSPRCRTPSNRRRAAGLERHAGCFAERVGRRQRRLGSCVLLERLLRGVGLSRAKAVYLHDLAARLVDGRLDLARLSALDDEPPATRSPRSRASGGSRPRRADAHAPRPDIWPAADLASRRAVAHVWELDNPPSLAEVDVSGALPALAHAAAVYCSPSGRSAARAAPFAAPELVRVRLARVDLDVGLVSRRARAVAPVGVCTSPKSIRRRQPPDPAGRPLVVRSGHAVGWGRAGSFRASCTSRSGDDGSFWPCLLACSRVVSPTHPAYREASLSESRPQERPQALGATLNPKAHPGTHVPLVVSQRSRRRARRGSRCRASGRRASGGSRRCAG